LKRIKLLLTTDTTGLSARQLVQLELCDPVRLFIKNEPHTSEKAKHGRWRLIASVSLVDQIIDRVLNRHINVAEIADWEQIPSKSGMGFSRSAIKSTIKYCRGKLNRPCNSDISAYDWSLKAWTMDFDRRFRIGSHFEDLSGSRYEKCLTSRYDCIKLSVFSLSDGELLEQTVPGINKTGLYITASLNSHTRVGLAILVDYMDKPDDFVSTMDAMAMGDDCVESYVDDAVAKYERLGFRVKFYSEVGNTFEFCSHVYGDDDAYALGIVKETMKLSVRKDIVDSFTRRAAVMQFCDDLRGNPSLEWLLDVLADLGMFGS